MLRILNKSVYTMSWIYKIRFMDIRDLDLNLLVIFDAMVRHRSVNRAAEAVGLSQPATSGALARLRTLFDDALFVRVGSQMEPTPKAQELAPFVQRVVETVSTEILQQTAFDPADSARTFTIITPDIGEVVFVPGVLHRLRQEARHVRLRTVSMPPKAAAEALESGAADLAVGFFPDLHKPGFFQQALFKTSYACVACSSNTAWPTKLTMKQYLEATHVVVRPDGREHMLEGFLQDKGLKRQVTAELSHFMSLISILPQTDLIATVPLDIATVLSRHIRVRRLGMPFKPPEIDVYQFWHRRMHHDKANQWLRQVFFQVNRRSSGQALSLSH